MLIANERKDRLALVAPIVANLELTTMPSARPTTAPMAMAAPTLRA